MIKGDDHCQGVFLVLQFLHWTVATALGTDCVCHHFIFMGVNFLAPGIGGLTTYLTIHLGSTPGFLAIP